MIYSYMLEINNSEAILVVKETTLAREDGRVTRQRPARTANKDKIR